LEDETHDIEKEEPALEKSSNKEGTSPALFAPVRKRPAQPVFVFMI